MANKPVEIVQLAGDAGKYKANLTPGNWLVRSFMAGLFIAVGGSACYCLFDGDNGSGD